MVKTVESQAKVGIAAMVLWRALTKDLTHVLQKAAPNLVKDAQLLEGDGGLGTLIFFQFGPDVPHMSYQKEKIVELDENQLCIGLEVVEGGHLNHGFTSYAAFFQLTSMGDYETLVHAKVVYESEIEDETLPEKTIESQLYFIKCLETYLQQVTM